MSVTVAKPDKYARCICCSSNKHDLCEFQFFQDTGMKMCITLCKSCVSETVVKWLLRDDTVNKLGGKE